MPIYLFLKEYVVPVYSVGTYDGIIKKCILKKYYRSSLHMGYLADLAHFFIKKYSLSFDYYIGIPMHPLKRMYRQFDHVQEILSVVLTKIYLSKNNAKFSNFTDVSAKYLKKSQVYLSLQGRKKIDEIFRFGESVKKLEGKSICIIDDVYTTGSTVRAMVKSLIASVKPRDITVLVIGRVI